MSKLEIKHKRSRSKKVEISVIPDKVVEKEKVDNDAIKVLLNTNESRYNTLDVEAYQSLLDNMSLNDLHAEAIRVGLKPLGDRSLTTRTLIDLFHEERRKFLPSGNGYPVNTNLEAEKRAKLAVLMRTQ